MNELQLSSVRQLYDTLHKIIKGASKGVKKTVQDSHILA